MKMKKIILDHFAGHQICICGQLIDLAKIMECNACLKEIKNKLKFLKMVYSLNGQTCFYL